MSPVSGSHNRTISLVAELAIDQPSGENATRRTGWLLARIDLTKDQSSVSHRPMVPSSPAEASMLPSGGKATELTERWRLGSVRSGSPVSGSEMEIEAPAVARRPSGENARDTTSSVGQDSQCWSRP